MPKDVPKKSKMQRHDPLGEQLLQDAATKNLRKVPRNNKRTRKEEEAEEAVNQPMVMNAQMSKKLLGAIEDQQREEQEERHEEFGAQIDMAGAQEAMCSDIEEEIEVDADGYLDIDCNEEELAAMSMFAAPQKEGGNTINLGDMILAAIKDSKDKKQAVSADSTGAVIVGGVNNEATEATAASHADAMSPKVIQVYTDIGKWLKNYKTGPLPKAFKVIPTLKNWEEVLCLTNPLDWSSNALMEATKIFSSNLNPKMAQRFYNLVLLPAVRHDMAEHKKLNFHYYEALKKAMFKPAAFMKGILLPIASESCTLREAHILSSVLSKISVPVLHASATLVRLCEMIQPWYGTTAIFMAVLINKKYSLPYSVIGHIVDHFCSFIDDDRLLPLVWHRCLLVFVQRYKTEFSQNQRDELLKLVKMHNHSGIGSEVKREIQSAVPRIVMGPQGLTSTVMAGTMAGLLMNNNGDMEMC